jgi:hypothetical protein
MPVAKGDSPNFGFLEDTRQGAAGGQTTFITPPCRVLFGASLKSR